VVLDGHKIGYKCEVENICKLIHVFSSLEMMNHKNPLEVPLGEFKLRNVINPICFWRGNVNPPFVSFSLLEN
jgi:hypothetical protein